MGRPDGLPPYCVLLAIIFVGFFTYLWQCLLEVPEPFSVSLLNVRNVQNGYFIDLSHHFFPSLIDFGFGPLALPQICRSRFLYVLHFQYILRLVRLITGFILFLLIVISTVPCRLRPYCSFFASFFLGFGELALCFWHEPF